MATDPNWPVKQRNLTFCCSTLPKEDDLLAGVPKITIDKERPYNYYTRTIQGNTAWDNREIFYTS